LEYEGTYPLPEAQQDRFLMKILLRYPSAENEIDVLKLHHSGFHPQNLEERGLQTVTSVEELKAVQAEVTRTKVEDKIFNYIYEIVKTTRDNRDIMVGASPRAGIGLLNYVQNQKLKVKLPMMFARESWIQFQSLAKLFWLFGRLRSTYDYFVLCSRAPLRDAGGGLSDVGSFAF
jgi:hypothetical protein